MGIGFTQPKYESMFSAETRKKGSHTAQKAGRFGYLPAQSLKLHENSICREHNRTLIQPSGLRMRD